MPSFKKIPDSKTIDAKYIQKVIVYLESEEDFQIFKERWFHDEGERVEFRSSDTGRGGGCAEVVRQVKSDRQNGIPAFGIVDRDAVMREGRWDVFWETDDRKYKNAMPLGHHIRPLCRWEIENYLLDPDELESILADEGKDFPRSKRPVELMIKELIGHCNTLIPVMALDILFHENGTSSLKIGFGSNCHNRNQVEQELSEKISDPDKFKDYKTRIEGFAEKHPSDSMEYLDRLNRMIDGKRIFHRIEHQNRLKDRRFTLARRIKEKDKIEAEVTEIINDFKRYAPT